MRIPSTVSAAPEHVAADGADRQLHAGGGAEHPGDAGHVGEIDHDVHSTRNASMGSSLAARRAGR